MLHSSLFQYHLESSVFFFLRKIQEWRAAIRKNVKMFSCKMTQIPDTADEPKSCGLKMRKRALTSQVQVSLRGWGASCWSWYTLGENTQQEMVWVGVLIITSDFQIGVCKSLAATYSKTSTLVACIRHDLRTGKHLRKLQSYSNLMGFATAPPGGHIC